MYIYTCTKFIFNLPYYNLHIQKKKYCFKKILLKNTVKMQVKAETEQQVAVEAINVLFEEITVNIRQIMDSPGDTLIYLRNAFLAILTTIVAIEMFKAMQYLIMRKFYDHRTYYFLSIL